MKRLALAAVAGLLASTAPLYAADIPFEAPIRSVVVYPQGAAITREGMFSIPAGTSVLIIGGLPTSIDTSSIRVGGLGDAGLQILSVEARQEAAKGPDEEDPVRTWITDAIQDLRDQQAVLNDQLVALQGQRTFIQNLIAEGPAGFAELLGANGAGINQWATAWQTIGQGMEQVLDGIRQVGLQQRAIEEQVAELMAQLGAIPQLRQGLEIRIEVAAAAAATGALATTYQVGNARWAPAYDAFLTTGDDGAEPGIELVRRAEIQQQTGENWTDVALTLSTSRPAGGTAAPYLSEAILQVYERGRYYDGAPAPAAAAEIRGGAFDAVAAPPPMPEQQAIADFGDFRADFIIPTPVSVDSGVGVRSVRLATDTAPARLFATATPRVAEQAFLTAAFTLESEAPILAGRANLFRDGSFIGTGGLAFTNPGQEVELGFGPDDQVHVTFALVTREAGERGLLTRVNTDERHYRITVENGHSRAMEITILDRVPVTEDERILVEQLPATTEPTETDVDGRRGILAWTYTYDPGETREIDNAYIVTWPADLDLFGIE